MGAFYARLGLCIFVSGTLEGAIQTTTKAVELCEASGNSEHAGYAYWVFLWSHLLRGNLQNVIASKETAIRKIEEKFDLHTCVRVLCACSQAWSWLGCWEEAIEEAQTALKFGEEYSENGNISFAAWNLVFAHLCKGDLKQAVKFGELAVSRAPTAADKVYSQAFYAWALCRSGRLEEGIKILDPLLPIVRAGGHDPATCVVLQIRGEAFRLARRYNEARASLEESLEVIDRCGGRSHIGWAQRLLGEIALKTNPDEAAPHFEEAISIFQEMKAENFLALAYSGMGRYHKQLGDVEKAREYLTKALEIFEWLGTLIEPDKVREELAGLA
jgi:tetratricopeptide (TPR) repeat protein